eukprot:INCI15882.1.p1 GENE.INCI15882.1~~INCI15882.1.p1  ORF type:complete len:987 (+),score=138.56 INCI15882.1:207-3167(+)
MRPSPQRQMSVGSLSEGSQLRHQPQSLGNGWFKVWNAAAGKFYYANSVTKESTWQPPSSVVGVPNAARCMPAQNSAYPPQLQRSIHGGSGVGGRHAGMANPLRASRSMSSPNPSTASSAVRWSGGGLSTSQRAALKSLPAPAAAAAAAAAAPVPSWQLDKGAQRYFYALGLRGLTQAYERARANVRLALELDNLSLDGAQLTHKYLVMAIEDLMQILKHTAVSGDTYIRVAMQECVKKLLSLAEKAHRQIQAGENRAGAQAFQDQLARAKYGSAARVSAASTDTAEAASREAVGRRGPALNATKLPQSVVSASSQFVDPLSGNAGSRPSASVDAACAILRLPLPPGHRDSTTVQLPQSLVGAGSCWGVDASRGNGATSTAGRSSSLTWPSPLTKRQWIHRNYDKFLAPRDGRHSCGEITLAKLTTVRVKEVRTTISMAAAHSSGRSRCDDDDEETGKMVLVYRHDIQTSMDLTRLAMMLCELDFFLRTSGGGGLHPQIHSPSALCVALADVPAAPGIAAAGYEVFIELLPISGLSLDKARRLLDWLTPKAKDSLVGEGIGGADAGKDIVEERGKGGFACGYEDWQLQSMVRQLLQALSSLHATNILAGFLLPEHVFVYEVSDEDTGSLDLEGSASGTKTNNTSIQSVRLSICGVPSSKRFAAQHAFSDPAVKSGEPPSAASDMWMVGAIVFYAITGDAPVLLPGAEAIRLPGSFRMRHGDRIADFLEQLLQRDGSKRLRCHEALISAYLNTSLVVDREADGQIIALSHKKEALFECIQSMRTARGRLHLRVSRATLVDDVVQGILAVPRANLLCKFSVRFEGEAGIDAGGLTAEMYSSFFLALLSPESLLFESSGSEDGSSQSGDNKALYLPKQLGNDLPASMQDQLLSMLEGVGRLLVKAIFDGQPVPAPFAPSLYKYLLGVTPNLHDLAAYDPSLADQLRMLLDAEDAEDMGVDFEDVGGECEEVTNENRARWVWGIIIFIVAV